MSHVSFPGFMLSCTRNRALFKKIDAAEVDRFGVYTQDDDAAITQLDRSWHAAPASVVIQENLPTSSSRKFLNAPRAMSAIKLRFRGDMPAKRC